MPVTSDVTRIRGKKVKLKKIGSTHSAVKRCGDVPRGALHVPPTVSPPQHPSECARARAPRVVSLIHMCAQTRLCGQVWSWMELSAQRAARGWKHLSADAGGVFSAPPLIPHWELWPSEARRV